MDLLQSVISVLVSTGVLAIIIHYHYDKKLKTHELKLKKYITLAEDLARLVGNDPNYDKLLFSLNEAILFASDNVVKEILRFNKVFTERRNARIADSFQITENDLKPLIVAIRKELYLKSKSIDKEGLRFFQKP